MSICPNCVPCSFCKGSGNRREVHNDWLLELSDCDNCNGSGVEEFCDVCANELSEEDAFEDFDGMERPDPPTTGEDRT
jgi:DnaJ-class molecular chaperone